MILQNLNWKRISIFFLVFLGLYLAIPGKWGNFGIRAADGIPAAPTRLIGTAGDEEVSLTWVAPEGSVVTDYQVEFKTADEESWTVFTDSESVGTSATVTGLTNEVTYDFQVKGINDNGVGAASNMVISTPYSPNSGVPGKPSNLTGITGDGEVSLTWTEGTGDTATDYVVEYKTSLGYAWLVYKDEVSIGTSAVATGLTNGTDYNFRVSGKNTNGTGFFSDTITATPTSPSSETPGAPTNLTGIAGDKQVSLSWTAPSESTITDYRIEYKLGIGSSWLILNDGVSVGTSMTVTGLTNNASYNFRVKGINSGVVGTASNTITITPKSDTQNNQNNGSSGNNNSGSSGEPARFVCTDATPIRIPDLFEIRASKGKAKLFFTPSERATSYAIIYGHKKDDERFGSIEGLTNNNQGVQNVTINLLNPKSTYYFKVAAINGCAIGSWSDWVPVQANKNKTVYKYKIIIKNGIKTLVNKFI